MAETTERWTTPQEDAIVAFFAGLINPTFGVGEARAVAEDPCNRCTDADCVGCLHR